MSNDPRAAQREPTPPKLISITFLPLPMFHGRSLTLVRCQAPEPSLLGWRLSLRGPTVWLISPPGWVYGKPREALAQKGSRTAYSVPTASCILRWEIGAMEDVDKLSKYDSDAFEMVAAPDGGEK